MGDPIIDGNTVLDPWLLKRRHVTSGLLRDHSRIDMTIEEFRLANLKSPGFHVPCRSISIFICRLISLGSRK